MFTATLVLFAINAVYGYLGRNLQADSSWSNNDLVLGALFGLAILMFPIAGVVLATKRPDNAIGWLMLAIGVGWAIGLGTAYAQYGLVLKPGSLPLANYVAAVSSAFWVPPICLMGSFLLLLFPDGHLLTPRWRWVARLAGFVIVFGTTMMILSPGKMGDTGFPDTVNPLGISSLSTVIHAATLTVVLVPVVIVLSAVSLVLRFRRSRGVERLQMKWLVWAAAFVAVSYGVAMALSLLVSFGSSTPPWLEHVQAASLSTFGLIPIAIGFGVLRYRLYEIDVIIRRTVVYAVLTVCLAVVYLAGIALIGAASREATGQSSAIAVTISTLLVAAVFQPLRSRIQRGVEHRFYRRTYDTELAVHGFTNRLREQIELDSLSHELLTTVHNTVQPRSASLWLRSVTISERSPGTTEA